MYSSFMRSCESSDRVTKQSRGIKTVMLLSKRQSHFQVFYGPFDYCCRLNRLRCLISTGYPAYIRLLTGLSSLLSKALVIWRRDFEAETRGSSHRVDTHGVDSLVT
jgi:hypothetical protein